MLEIIYQDEYFVAVNKPAGMLVHRSWLTNMRLNLLCRHCAIKLVSTVFQHRTDRSTSGVLVFALSSEVASEVMMFANHEMQKTYHAIVRGWIEEGDTLDYALKVELDKIADKFAKEDKEPQEAVTVYEPLAKVEVPYSTGRFPYQSLLLS